MPEIGGPTTQSGILYQNSIAALYLGQMIDSRPVAIEQRIVAVRIEAPEFIDDIVVTFASGSRLLIQAKEALTVGSEPWKSFWKDVAKQFVTPGMTSDSYLLSVGNYSEDLNELRELIERAKGKDNSSEWLDGLNKRHVALKGKLMLATDLKQADLFDLFHKMSVQFLTFEQIETVGIRDKIPASSVAPDTLFTVLRDLCGGAGRVRDTFTPRSLAEILNARKQIKLVGTTGDGLANYMRSIESKYSTISVPGTSLSGTSDKLWVAPSLLSAEPSQGRDFEEESYHTGRFWSRRPSGAELLQLQKFPMNGPNRILIEAGAGFGKTTVIASIARHLAAGGVYVPAVLSAQLIAGQTNLIEVLDQHINREFHAAIDWSALLYQGRAVLLIDGVDELSDEARATAIEHIRQTTAIFSDVPIVVTTRDGASIPLKSSFSSFRIGRLDHDHQAKVLKRYLDLRPGIKAKQLEHRLMRSDELSALCAIPLFLALLVATLPDSGKLPKSRSELLERYLAVALAPQQHRPVSRPRLPLTKLRLGAETLALAALKRYEIAIPETNARVELNAVLGQDNGDYCVEDLIQCGLILRKGFRVGFAIATVQEYLAGCAVSQLDKANISKWFSNVARRPWAQALQFAIEKAVDIEPALIQQLDADSVGDIFHTSLLIVARSIANGLKVSEDFRKLVVDQLLSVWNSHWEIERRVDSLLLDGLALPPSPRLIQLLEKQKSTNARADLIAQIGNQPLALNALKSILKGSDIRELWSRSWHDLIRPISLQVVPMLLDKAREADDLAAGVIANLIFELRGNSEIGWSDIVQDSRLPASVRVAALWGAGHENTTEGRKAIESLVAENELRGWTDFTKAYYTTEWWRDHFNQIVFGSPESINARTEIFDKLIDELAIDDPRGHRLVEHLTEVLATPQEAGPALLAARLLAASLDILSSDAEVLESPSPIGREEIGLLTSYLPYLSEDLKMSVVQAIQASVFCQPNEWETIDFALQAAKMVPVGRMYFAPRGPFLTSRSKPPVARAVADWAIEYLSRCQLDTAKRASLLTQLLEMDFGDENELAAMINDFTNTSIAVDRDSWNWIASASRVLIGAGYQFSAETLWKLTELSVGYPTSMFFSAIIELQGPLCAGKLAAVYRSTPAQRGPIQQALREIAPERGISVSIPSGHLVLSWPS